MSNLNKKIKNKKKTKLLKRQKQDVWLGSLGVTARELLHLGPSEPLTTILINHFSLNQMLMKKKKKMKDGQSFQKITILLICCFLLRTVLSP